MSMACDELSDRIRSLLPSLQLVEKKMFGGIAFMLAGNMLVCPTREGSLIVRVGKEGMADALQRPGAAVMEMGGRPMSGFVELKGDAIEDDETLAGWLDLARSFVETLPAKQG